MPHPNRPRPSQLHHHQTYGAEPDAPSARQGLPTPQAKGGRMGRRLPRQPHRSIICSPDCPGVHRTIAVAITTAMLTTAAVAQDRPSTTAMTCQQAASLVYARGAIVLGTGGYTYDRFVRDRSFCQVTEALESA